MSLTEELLADLEDDDEELEGLIDGGEGQDDKDGIKKEAEEAMDIDEKTKGGEKIRHTFFHTLLTCTFITLASNVREVAKLHDSPELVSVLDRMDSFSASARTAKDLTGPVEADPEYQLIVEANNVAAKIDEEISKFQILMDCLTFFIHSGFLTGTIYKFAKDRYTVRFPELETLVVQPLEYLLSARELGNNVLKAKNNKVLEAFLTQATIMVVSVTASTTQG